MLSDSLHYELTFGVSVMNMDKAERLRFGESMMTHAMTITGMHIEVLPQQCYAYQNHTTLLVCSFHIYVD